MQVNPSDNHSTVSETLLPELDLKVYVRILWHWSWLLILCTLLAGGAAYIASQLSAPIYQASTTLLIDEARKPTASYQDLLTSERIARTYAELIQRETILAQVARQFNTELAVLQSALTNIDVTPVRDTQLIKVTVEGLSPELVAAVADTLPRVFITEINAVQSQRFADSKRNLEQQLDSLRNQVDLTQIEIDDIGQSRTAEEEVRLGQLRGQLTQAQNSYTNVLRSYEELRLTEVQSVDSVVIVENAKIPTTPVRPRPLVNTLLAAIVGGMLALGVIFLIEYLDDRIKTPQDLQQVLNTPILGVIAHMPHAKSKQRQKKADPSRQDDLIVANQPRHPIAESYRRLRTNLRFTSVDEQLHTLLVTSAVPGEGKTTTAANLAIAMAQAGYRVIMIDADLRKPQLHHVFQLSKGPGLTDALLNDTPPAFFLRETTVENLQVMTCGSIPPNPAELLGSRPMRKLLETLKAESDMLIIDTPPLLAVTDAQILSDDVQGVLLVVNSSRTARTTVATGATTLHQVGARLLGVVLNDMTSSPRGYYYYDSYNNYYYTEDEKKESTSSTSKPGKPSSAPAVPTYPALRPGHIVANQREELQAALPTTTNGHYQLKSDQEKS
ncbi:MAG: polysaccharide biosynthesis tyrosine autokinase [Caldilineaceae bacterium]|nr:polysaccharide biosynthesis tyrosine autokinase [Caldilineaceae bacterium]